LPALLHGGVIFVTMSMVTYLRDPELVSKPEDPDVDIVSSSVVRPTLYTSSVYTSKANLLSIVQKKITASYT
jgi:hypothetical protein